MLRELHVRNFALLEDVRVEFGPGLNVLTGETGAGKSILLDALGACLGHRVGSDVIRTGATEARVEAVFELARAPEARAALDAAGIPLEDEVLILVREIGGRGRAYANGTPVTVGTLREIGSFFVEIHGQHEGQRLLEPRTHLELLDASGDETVRRLRVEVEEAFARWSGLRSALAELERTERERARRLDLLRWQVQEIEAVHPRPEELAELEAARTRLVHAGRLAEATGGAYEALCGEEGAIRFVGKAAALLRQASQWDPGLYPLLQALEAARVQLDEVGLELRRYAEEVQADPRRLEEVEVRLHALRALQRKYGDTVEEILAYRERALQEIAHLENLELHRAEVEGALREAEGALGHAVAALSAARREAARRLERSVEAHLRELGMPEARFWVGFEIREDPEGVRVLLPEEEHRRLQVTPRGVDRVEFLFSANPGEPPRPLHRVASGGELARLMLALRSALAEAHPTPVMVFDEVDAGVGGHAAHVVGTKLASLARGAQVLCVTHLAQIAARADVHHAIRKVTSGGRTRTEVHRVEGDARVEEIARMLAGDPPTELSRRHAQELLLRHRTARSR
ncbi:MAG: DNA repair protein RecN [Armatimonadetes bacterium]|nr:DNA repair protein RecN [Armatimonadota bacterium]MDW8153275.1 DNA repair protein RecN [Armatimonadota bacterium]